MRFLEFVEFVGFVEFMEFIGCVEIDGGRVRLIETDRD
jgi:hypothetical protein